MEYEDIASGIRAILHTSERLSCQPGIKENGPLYKKSGNLCASTRKLGKDAEGVDHLKQRAYVLNHTNGEWQRYPGGLKGEKIPREGRLLAIADALMP